MNIYVGNLSYDASEEDLRGLFQAHGNVVSVKIVRDRDSGRSKGFGFVEMGSKDEGEAAISALNGQDLHGRALRISEARPKNDSPRPRGGGGGGGGGYRGNGGGNRGGGGGRGGYRQDRGDRGDRW